MLKLSKRYSSILKELIDRYKLEIIDTHLHPLDAMNILDSNDYVEISRDLLRWKDSKEEYGFVLLHSKNSS